MDRKALFITVRSDSSRLPGKWKKEILGRPVLEMIISRAKLAKEFNEVVVCTSERPVDDGIEELAERNGAVVFRGSLNDKLLRWQGAANKYNIDYVVTFDGDDLFCDPRLLDMGADQIESRGLDFIEAPEHLICGAFTYAFTSKALNKVCEIKNSDDTEMMWTYFKDSGLFRCGKLEKVPDIYFSDKIRSTLDYPEDYEFFTKVFEHFNCINNDVGLDEIVKYLNENPEVAKINIGRQQEFLDNQKAKTHLVLKQK